MATAQVQGVPDEPLQLSQSQFPHHYPRGAPSERFISPPPTGYHQTYFSQSQPSASPFSYYSMIQPNEYSNGSPYAMQPHHPSPPYQQHYGSFSTPFSPYRTSPPTERHKSIALRGGNSSEFPLGPPGMENASAIDDDPTSIFLDIHLLLSRLEETYGQVIQEAEAQQADIDQLLKQLEELKKSHSSETNKLRLEIGDRKEHKKELKEQVAKLIWQIANIEDDKKALEAANKTLASRKAILEQEKVNLEKSVTEEKERLLEEFENWKVKANETFEADKMTLAIEFEKKLEEQEASAENNVTEEKERLLEEFENWKVKANETFEADKMTLVIEFEKKLEKQEASAENIVTEEKECLLEEFENWKVKANKTFEADKMALAIEFDKKLKEQEASAEKNVTEEKAGMSVNLSSLPKGSFWN